MISLQNHNRSTKSESKPQIQFSTPSTQYQSSNSSTKKIKQFIKTVSNATSTQQKYYQTFTNQIITRSSWKQNDGQEKLNKGSFSNQNKSSFEKNTSLIKLNSLKDSFQIDFQPLSDRCSYQMEKPSVEGLFQEIINNRIEQRDLDSLNFTYYHQNKYNTSSSCYGFKEKNLNETHKVQDSLSYRQLSFIENPLFLKQASIQSPLELSNEKIKSQKSEEQQKLKYKKQKNLFLDQEKIEQPLYQQYLLNTEVEKNKRVDINDKFIQDEIENKINKQNIDKENKQNKFINLNEENEYQSEIDSHKEYMKQFFETQYFNQQIKSVVGNEYPSDTQQNYIFPKKQQQIGNKLKVQNNSISSSISNSQSQKNKILTPKVKLYEQNNSQVLNEQHEIMRGIYSDRYISSDKKIFKLNINERKSSEIQLNIQLPSIQMLPQIPSISQNGQDDQKQQNTQQIQNQMSKSSIISNSNTILNSNIKSNSILNKTNQSNIQQEFSDDNLQLISNNNQFSNYIQQNNSTPSMHKMKSNNKELSNLSNQQLSTLKYYLDSSSKQEQQINYDLKSLLQNKECQIIQSTTTMNNTLKNNKNKIQLKKIPTEGNSQSEYDKFIIQLMSDLKKSQRDQDENQQNTKPHKQLIVEKQINNNAPYHSKNLQKIVQQQQNQLKMQNYKKQLQLLKFSLISPKKYENSPFVITSSSRQQKESQQQINLQNTTNNEQHQLQNSNLNKSHKNQNLILNQNQKKQQNQNKQQILNVTKQPFSILNRAYNNSHSNKLQNQKSNKSEEQADEHSPQSVSNQNKLQPKDTENENETKEFIKIKQPQAYKLNSKEININTINQKYETEIEKYDTLNKSHKNSIDQSNDQASINLQPNYYTDAKANLIEVLKQYNDKNNTFESQINEDMCDKQNQFEHDQIQDLKKFYELRQYYGNKYESKLNNTHFISIKNKSIGNNQFQKQNIQNDNNIDLDPWESNHSEIDYDKSDYNEF